MTNHKSALLPDFCSVPIVLGVVVYGELLAIILTVASPFPLTSFWVRLGPLSVMAQLMALTSAALLCWSRPHLARLDSRWGAIVAWGLMQCATLGVLFMMLIGLPDVVRAALLPHDGISGMIQRSCAISAIVGVLLLRYLYLHHQWRQEVERSAQTRFQLLQARIRPHFLFNSMNTIAQLTRTDPVLAETIIEDLADLFRAALATDREVATVAEELALVRGYLQIESQRLGERLRVEWAVNTLPATVLTQVTLPLLTLQPLIENAVYHGIQPATTPGVIRIAGYYAAPMVHLMITNTLPALGTPFPPGQHMALANVQQRLVEHFTGRAQLHCTHTAQQYTVHLQLPWRPQ